MPIKMKSLVDNVSDMGSKVVGAPNSEAEGIKQRLQNQDEYKGAMQPMAPAAAPEKSAADAINPSAQYGDRGKEKRISPADLNEMTKPLGGTAAPVPNYDCGGMVY